MDPATKNDGIHNQLNSVYYNKVGEDGFYRVKSVDKRITQYVRVECLSSRDGAKVYLCKPVDGGRCKVIKCRESRGRTELEYEMSLNWPKDATGLMLRSKAFLMEPFEFYFVMHHYDGMLAKVLPDLSLKDRIEAVGQLGQGLATLHGLKINHGDIHEGNIFYDKSKNRFDLGDFEHGGICEDEEDFKERSEDDIVELKKCIEYIIMGGTKITNGRALNNLEDVLKLGFDESVSKLILSFMDCDVKDANDMLQQLMSIKQQFESHSSL